MESYAFGLINDEFIRYIFIHSDCQPLYFFLYKTRNCDRMFSSPAESSTLPNEWSLLDTCNEHDETDERTNIDRMFHMR